MFEDILILDSLHSLIVGNTPDKLDIPDYTNKILDSKDSFDTYGLFDSSNANFGSYYPDVTASDLEPQEDEFIYPVFRALSAAVIQRGYTDYSRNGVLKKSLQKLKGQTVYPNHDMVIGAHLGVVSEVYWQEEYKASNGLIVPAGINAKLKIDGKANPNIARAINMTPPALHSVSVTIQFLWEKSHPKMDDSEFWAKLGTMGPDKQMVSRIVTEVVRYWELSIVPHGADPFAKILGADGKIIPSNIAKAFAKNAEELKTKHAVYSFKELAANSVIEKNNVTIPIETNHIITDDMDFTKLATALGLNKKPEELTEADILTAIGELKTSNTGLETSVTTLKNEKTQLETQLAEARADGLKSKADADKYSQMVTDFRAKVLENYNKVMGDKKDEAIIKLIGSSDYDTLTSLNKDYAQRLEAMYPLECKDCHSKNVERSSNAAAGETDHKPAGNKPKTAGEIHRDKNTIKLHE